LANRFIANGFFLFYPLASNPLAKEKCKLFFRTYLKPLTLCGDYTITHIRLNRLHLVRLRIRRREGRAKIREVQMLIDKLETKLLDVELNQRWNIKRELELLKDYLQILDEQFVNPRIPYEEEDLQI
jgi:hypothetical protein